MKVNKIYNEDCLDTMARMPDCFVDLTVTSPPYDNLRTYTGEMQWNEGVWKAVIKFLYRVTKQGGVVVWIVGDATIKGSETLTSFKQAIHAKDVGFNLHDTMIWNKNGFSAVGALKTRYSPVFEYMFIFSKSKPKTFNPIKDKPNKNAGKLISKTKRLANGETKKGKSYISSDFGQRYNIWKQCPHRQRGCGKHPAPFPKQLIHDHIISWSNLEDLVYDPFMGSGTTAKMAILNKRNYIGSEISKEYCEIAKKRINELPLLARTTMKK